MAITRRTLLGVGAVGTGMLAIGGVGLALQKTRPFEPRQPLRALTPRQFSVLASATEALLPGDGRLPSGLDLGIPERIDEQMSTVEPWAATELGKGLLTLENALPGLLLDGRLRPFTARTLADRAATLERWRTSSIQLRRQIYRAIDGLVSAAYWAQPATWAHTGYPGPPDFGQLNGAFPHPPLVEPVAVEQLGEPTP